MIKLISFLILTTLLSCSKNGNPIPIVIEDNTNSVPKNLQTAKPVSPTSLSDTGFINSTPNPMIGATLKIDEPAVNTGPLDPDSKSVVQTQDNGGQAGFFFNQNINGIYVNNTAYPDLIMNPPSSSSPYNVLYAPTTKLGSGGCLELSMDYWRDTTGTTSRALRLYSFCNNINWNTGIDIPLDSDFQNKYLRDLGYGLPQFTAEILGDSNNVWRALIYNYSSSKWELLYTSQSATSTFDNGESWSFFETHYSTGTCTITPPIVSSNIKLLSNGVWSDFNYNNNERNFGDCFNDINNSPATNQFINIDDNSWVVTGK